MNSWSKAKLKREKNLQTDRTGPNFKITNFNLTIPETSIVIEQYMEHLTDLNQQDFFKWLVQFKDIESQTGWSDKLHSTFLKP